MIKMDGEKSKITFDKMCGLYVRVLRMIAVLPFEGRNFGFIVTRIITVYLFCTSMMHWSMFTVYCFTSKAVQLEDVCVSLLVVGLNCRFYIVLYNRKTFESMINDCRLLWDFCTAQGQQTVMLFEQKIRRVYQIFFFSCICVNIMYPIDALITRLPPLEANATERRILPFNWYADNTENNWPGYWSIFALQMIFVQSAIIYAVACDTATPLLVMISSGYFRHLSDRLSSLDNNPNLRRLEQENCISFHQRLLRFCSRVSKFANMMLLTQILSTGYNISLILIKLVSSDRDKYKYISVLCIFICQLYIIQWAPDHLHDESEGVAVAAFSAYVQSLGDRRLNNQLLSVIMRAQKPVQLLAGGFIVLSLESFGNMIKSAFSFFTILRNLDL